MISKCNLNKFLIIFVNVEKRLFFKLKFQKTVYLVYVIMLGPLEISKGRPFKVGNKSEGRPLANKGITRLKHLWDAETKAWKPMATLGLQKRLAITTELSLCSLGTPILLQSFFTLGIGPTQREEEPKKSYLGFTTSLTSIQDTWRLKSTQGKQLMAY